MRRRLNDSDKGYSFNIMRSIYKNYCLGIIRKGDKDHHCLEKNSRHGHSQCDDDLSKIAVMI